METIDGWVEVNSNFSFWDPEDGESILEGEIVAKRNNEFGLSVTVKTSDGHLFGTPSHRVLQNKLEGCEVGDFVRIEFSGESTEKKAGKNAAKLYKVLRRQGIKN